MSDLGETYETAIRNAEEALSVYLQTLTANGDSLPEAPEIEGVRVSRESKLTPDQIDEVRHRIAKGESMRDLAKRYGVSVISRFAA